MPVLPERVVVEDHRRHHDRERSHSDIGYRVPKQAFMETWLLDAEAPNSPCPPLDPLTKTAARTTRPNLSPVLEQSQKVYRSTSG